MRLRPNSGDPGRLTHLRTVIKEGFTSHGEAFPGSTVRALLVRLGTW